MFMIVKTRANLSQDNGKEIKVLIYLDSNSDRECKRHEKRELLCSLNLTLEGSKLFLNSSVTRECL